MFSQDEDPVEATISHSCHFAKDNTRRGKLLIFGHSSIEKGAEMLVRRENPFSSSQMRGPTPFRPVDPVVWACLS